MGGIFGVISGFRSVAPLIRLGLERLIHRGVDGAGIVTLYEGKFFIKKDAGRIDDVHKKLNFDDLPGYVGLGHVRSATHGRPVYENTHPFLDCKGNIALVMDGVIAGYDELRDRLEGHHKISSRTDAELLAHLIEEAIDKEGNVLKAVSNVVKELRGYYAAAFIYRIDGNVYAFSMGNPLIVGISQSEYYISSEEQALPNDVRNVYYLTPGRLAVLSNSGVKGFDLTTLTKVELAPQTISGVFINVVKGSFKHFMLKEIYDTPEALARSINLLQVEYLRDAAHLIDKAKNIMLTGSGTSYHAALIGKYYLRALANVSSDVIPAGEFLYEGLDLVEPGTLVIAISQSGESTDVVRAVRTAKRKGAAILSIVNRLGTTLMRESNIYLPIGAGPEMAVPATKTFTATLSILLQLASMVSDKLEWAQSSINTVIKLIANNLDSINKRANEIAEEIKDSIGTYVISGGPVGMPLALEAALKLKEAVQLHAEAYNFRELKHGPITLVSREFPVIAILPGGDVNADMETVITEVWYRGGTVIIVGDKYGRKLGDYALTFNEAINSLLTPIAYAPVIQLLAYNLGIIRGIDVDNPRHLTKVVTT